jgi:hypothetical protein
MARTTPRNPQPFRAVLMARRISVPQAAELCGVKIDHLRDCADGRVRPNDQVRERLPLITGVPLHELFTADRLDRPHRTRSVWRKS